MVICIVGVKFEKNGTPFRRILNLLLQSEVAVPTSGTSTLDSKDGNNTPTGRGDIARTKVKLGEFAVDLSEAVMVLPLFGLFDVRLRRPFSYWIGRRYYSFFYYGYVSCTY